MTTNSGNFTSHDRLQTSRMGMFDDPEGLGHPASRTTPRPDEKSESQRYASGKAAVQQPTSKRIKVEEIPRKGSRSKMTVESMAADYNYIDVLNLHRRGLLADHWISFVPLLGWPGVAKIRASRYLIVIEWSDRPDPQQIRVAWTRCHLGGARPWIHCACGRRVARLFKGLAGYYCRQCLGSPRYASQTKSTQNRLHFEACKLRLRLGGVASLMAPFPDRPRGMHKKTYARLRRRSEQLEARISPRLRDRPTDYPNLCHYLP